MTDSFVVTALSYPNPSKDGAANLYFEVSGTAAGVSAQARASVGAYDSQAKVHLRIFSRSGRMLWETSVTGVQAGGNSYHWNGRDLSGAPLPNGMYFYSATVESSAGKITTGRSPLLILK
jgi:flagellar hook assembly protein FlgD